VTDPQNEPRSSSLTPVETENAGVYTEAGAMNKGNGLKLAAVGAGAVALIAVGVAVLGNLDSRQAYVDAGSRVAALHESGFEGFWNCVLVNMNQAQIKSPDDLEFQIDKRAEHFGHAYAGQFQKCAKGLDSLERDLTTLSVPESLRASTHALEQSAGALRHAMQDFVAVLDEHPAQYSSEAAKPSIAKLASAWQQYKQSHTAFTDALRGHLN
jgi:hypothetical protein